MIAVHIEVMVTFVCYLLLVTQEICYARVLNSCPSARVLVVNTIDSTCPIIMTYTCGMRRGSFAGKETTRQVLVKLCCL